MSNISKSVKANVSKLSGKISALSKTTRIKNEQLQNPDFEGYLWKQGHFLKVCAAFLFHETSPVVALRIGKNGDKFFTHVNLLFLF